MARILGESLGLFLLPFVVYFGLLAVRRRFGIGEAAWVSDRLMRLAAVGLGLAIAGFFLLGILEPRHRGAYVPAHIENGQLVPGHMQ